MTIEIPRDRWSRPLIIPLDANGVPDLSQGPVKKGNYWTGGVPYTRVSTSAGSLDDKSNLMKWKQRVTALGLGRRDDLALAVKAILAKYDDPLNDPEAKGALNKLLDPIEEAGGGNSASTKGTAWHELTEALDQGRTLPPLSDDITLRLDEYRAATAHLEVLAIEVFVINDRNQTAGTFDRLYGCPDNRARIGDLKTGKDDPHYPLKVAIQMADYANGFLYDPETGERTPIHPDLDPDTGLLVHMPDRKTGCAVYDINLVNGTTAAATASEVHAIRKWKKDDLITAHAFA